MRADVWDCPQEGCDVVFTEAEGGHLAIMEHLVAVHIRGGRDTTSPGFGMGASEPAEPTTRPQDDVIERAARAIFVRQLRDRQTVTVKYLGWQVDAWRDEPADGKAEYRADARVLAEAGLLADPAQTTELERLRARIEHYQAELDKARGERAFAIATSEAWKQERNDLERLMRRDQAQALRATVGRDLARTERDALSLLLRGMARKLVAYRRWTSGETPTIHKLFDALRAEASSADDVTMSAIRLMNRAGQERDQALAERDERQTHIDAAFRTCDAAELIAKIGSMEDPDRWKVVFATVTDVRAALNGELPAAEEPARLHITIPDADAAGDLP